MLEDELYRFESVTDDIFPDFEENKLERILADETVETETVKTKTGMPQSMPEVSKDTVVMNAVEKRNTVMGNTLGGQGNIFTESDDGRKTVVMNVKDIEDAQEI
jgi:hypothetical protein